MHFPVFNNYISLFSLIVVVFKVSEVQAFGRSIATTTTPTKKSRCLNPPRTARRVELYIKECQEEVRTKLVSEAYQILKDELNDEEQLRVEDHDERGFVEQQEYSHRKPKPFQHPQHPLSFIQSGIKTEIETGTESRETEAGTGAESIPERVPNYFDYAALEEDTPDRRRVAVLRPRISRVSGDATSGIYHPTLVPFEDKRIAGCLLHCIYAKNNAIDKLGWPTLDGLVNFYSEGVNEHGFFMATLRSVNLCLHAVTKKYHVNRRKQPERGESCDVAFDVFDCISDQITGYCLDHYKQ